MNCSNCEKDTAYQDITTQAIKVSGREEYILVQDIPVSKCRSCHEVLFDAKVAKQLDEFRKNPNLVAEKSVNVAQFPKVA